MPGSSAGGGGRQPFADRRLEQQQRLESRTWHAADQPNTRWTVGSSTVTAADVKPPNFQTPKQRPSMGSVPTPGSQYYAGFGVGFVEDVIDHLQLCAPATIIDPWNGSGTTTQVAAQRGLPAVGIDINPALVVVGKSKLFRGEDAEGVRELTSQILTEARRTPSSKAPGDPLTQWFTLGTAAHLRSIEQTIQRLLVRPEGAVDLSSAGGLEELSARAASVYVSLFETVRGFLAPFTTSNPTWIKNRGGGAAQLSLQKDRIDELFSSTVINLHQSAQHATFPGGGDGEASIGLGSSTAIPVEDASADACIGSPPYCTRIDYAVLTRPELAVLGMGEGAVWRELRDASIGTSTMTPATLTTDVMWGTYVNELMQSIETHPSKASSTYYRRYFLQYFDSMFRSLTELRRVLHADGPCALVVQDSYYKEIRIDLARCMTEMASQAGWSRFEQIDFRVPWNRAGAHPLSRQYRATSPATESLVIFRA